MPVGQRLHLPRAAHRLPLTEADREIVLAAISDRVVPPIDRSDLSSLSARIDVLIDTGEQR